MREERYTQVNEIIKNFKAIDENTNTAGPIIFSQNGINYYDDSESHIQVDGMTGQGKSLCVSIPFAINVINAGENLICIDPKGDLYEKTEYLARKKHRVICLDFRNPRLSPDKWNPLSSPYEYYNSKDPDKMDIASSQIDELAHNMYPLQEHSDAFWPNSAADFLSGITYTLFDIGNEHEVNINSISNIMRQAEIKIGINSAIKELDSSLDPNSLAHRYLATYCTAPNDTRGSIHSVAANGLNVFSKSIGLMEMLSSDTININQIDMDEKPFAVYCIIPDETNTYDSLAAIFISQLTQHLIRLAHDKYNKKLPIKTNIILEELSSIGKSLNNLPNLMVASRSRNIRIMLVLQSGYSQLEDIYGKSKAETINSCIGITFAFSTNNWRNLEELSKRCGEKYKKINNNIIKEPLITPCSLAAMPICTALLLIHNKYKYITKFPFYYEMFDMSDWKFPENNIKYIPKRLNIFNLEKYVKNLKEKKINDLFNSRPSSPFTPMPPNPFNRQESPKEVNIDNLVRRIDEKIAELEKEEKKE